METGQRSFTNGNSITDAQSGPPKDISFAKLGEIIKKYQDNPASSFPNEPTVWAHFPMRPIADFLIRHGIHSGLTLEQLQTGGNIFGLRIYFTQHKAADDCPDDEGVNGVTYIGRNSVALVMTISPDGGDTWYDVDIKGEGGALVAGKDGSKAGILSALDRTELYPPGGKIKNDRHPRVMGPRHK